MKIKLAFILLLSVVCISLITMLPKVESNDLLQQTPTPGLDATLKPGASGPPTVTSDEAAEICRSATSPTTYTNDGIKTLTHQPQFLGGVNLGLSYDYPTGWKITRNNSSYIVSNGTSSITLALYLNVGQYVSFVLDSKSKMTTLEELIASMDSSLGSHHFTFPNAVNGHDLYLFQSYNAGVILKPFAKSTFSVQCSYMYLVDAGDLFLVAYTSVPSQQEFDTYMDILTSIQITPVAKATVTPIPTAMPTPTANKVVNDSIPLNGIWKVDSVGCEEFGTIKSAQGAVLEVKDNGESFVIADSGSTLNVVLVSPSQYRITEFVRGDGPAFFWLVKGDQIHVISNKQMEATTSDSGAMCKGYEFIYLGADVSAAQISLTATATSEICMIDPDGIANVRQSPSTRSSILLKLRVLISPIKQTIGVDGYTWWEIEIAGGRIGWVRDDAVLIHGDCSKVPRQ